MSSDSCRRDVTASTTRTIEFDYVRVLAAAAVVFIHAAATAVARLESGDVWNPLFLLRNYATFSVPAFIFISGALVWTRPPAHGSRAYFRFLGHRLSAVVPAYLIWSAAYWLIVFGGYGWEKRGTGRSAGIVGFLWQVFTGTAWVHLYFVPLIVLIYAVTPLAARLISRSRSGAFAVSIALALGWIAAAPTFADVPGVEVAGRFFSYLPFAVCGAWYELRRQEGAASGSAAVRSWFVYLAAGITMQTLYATGVVGPWPQSPEYLVRLGWTVAIIVGLAGAFSAAAERLGSTVRPAKFLSSLTYWVYLMHPALLLLFYGLVRDVGATQLWTDPRYVALKWGFACFGSFLLAAAYLICTRLIREHSSPDSSR